MSAISDVRNSEMGGMEELGKSLPYVKVGLKGNTVD